MLTTFKKLQILISALVVFLLLVLLTGSAFAAHPSFELLDRWGQHITSADGLHPVDGSPVENAFSFRTSCGACHNGITQPAYEDIEVHSYHAQLAANDQYGFNPMNPDGDAWESGPSPKGKNWVQAQGHVGAW